MEGEGNVNEIQERFLEQATPLMEQLDGWTFFVESSGGWSWSFGSEFAIYATPFWEGCAGIPLQFIDPETDDILFSVFLPFTPTGNTWEDAKRYREMIRPYLAIRPNDNALLHCWAGEST